MSASLFTITAIGSSLDSQLSIALAAGNWNSFRDDDYTMADPLFSSLPAFRAPYAVWRDLHGLIQYTAPAPLGTATFLWDPSKAAHRWRIDFPALTVITDFGRAVDLPRYIGGTNPFDPSSSITLPADTFRTATVGVYAFRLPASFLKANASAPVLV